MTWLSRLLPQNPNLQRLANQDQRFRQGKRRRRSMKLELLESRTLLSNVSTSMPTPSSPLTITGDAFNDNFVITENLNGTVTVAPGATHFVPIAGLVVGSTINGSGVPFTTSSAVSSIIVSLPGTTNFDFVSLEGQGKTTPTTVQNVTVTATGANLTFAAGDMTGVDNSGALVVSDTTTSTTNAVLTATVTNSTFTTMSITQTGGGPDHSTITLRNDSVAGGVVASEGTANGDIITLNGDTFGMTTLLQGNGGPTNSNSLGNNDMVTVSGGTYRSLNVDQLLNGTHDTINISGVLISPINSNVPVVVDGVTVLPNGIFTMQGNGALDSTSISGVGTTTPAPPINLPLPPHIVLSSITVVQGNGSVGLASPIPAAPNDTASVTTSSVGGNISITQSDLASNSPSWNVAMMSGDTAGGTISITQGDAGGTSVKGGPTTTGDQATVTGSKSGGNTTVIQGMGSNDSATVSGSTVGGSLSITQADVAANPAGDTALIMNDTVTGNASITQGQANGDSATIDPTTIGGNASIVQGNGNNDTALISVVSVGGSASIVQGDGNNDSAAIDPPTITIGGSVTILQGAGNNDTALISGVTDGGGTDKAPIVISITQGGGNGDSATILNLTVTGGTAATPIPITISQGAGSGDSARIQNVTAANSNVTITQADVAGGTSDTAFVLNVTTGTTSAGFDVNGNVAITQGNAPGDVALVQDGMSNNVAITQGDNVQVLNGSTFASDIAEVNRTTVTSDITIIQGTGTSTAPGSGNYVAAIALDYLGLVGTNPDTPGSGTVTAGGSTLIDQQYANNFVLLGDAGDSFSTTFLDVFTGGGGGAFVQVLNTTVFFGPLGFFGSFSIEGGGTGNSIFVFNNSGVTFDPAVFNVLS
jgi:hypothetical protein